MIGHREAALGMGKLGQVDAAKCGQRRLVLRHPIKKTSPLQKTGRLLQAVLLPQNLATHIKKCGRLWNNRQRQLAQHRAELLPCPTADPPLHFCPRQTVQGRIAGRMQRTDTLNDRFGWLSHRVCSRCHGLSATPADQFRPCRWRAGVQPAGDHYSTIYHIFPLRSWPQWSLISSNKSRIPSLGCAP